MSSQKNLVGRAPAGSSSPVTISPQTSDVGRATSEAPDLRALRAWSAAASGRSFTLHGIDGRGGVTLIEWRRGERYEVRLDSMASAATGAADGRLRWRNVPLPEPMLNQAQLRRLEKLRKRNASRARREA